MVIHGNLSYRALLNRFDLNTCARNATGKKFALTFHVHLNSEKDHWSVGLSNSSELVQRVQSLWEDSRFYYNPVVHSSSSKCHPWGNKEIRRSFQMTGVPQRSEQSRQTIDYRHMEEKTLHVILGFVCHTCYIRLHVHSPHSSYVYLCAVIKVAYISDSIKTNLTVNGRESQS